MEATGASNSRTADRNADSSWLSDSTGLPAPAGGGRQRWLMLNTDALVGTTMSALPPVWREEHYPRLPDVWTFSSQPRTPVVITAHGGAASTSLTHSMRPLSARPINPPLPPPDVVDVSVAKLLRAVTARPSTAGPGGAAAALSPRSGGGVGGPAGAWMSLALRAPRIDVT